MADYDFRRLRKRLDLKLSQIQHLLAQLDSDTRAENAQPPPHLDDLLDELSHHFEELEEVLREIAEQLRFARAQLSYTDTHAPG